MGLRCCRVDEEGAYRAGKGFDLVGDLERRGGLLEVAAARRRSKSSQSPVKNPRQFGKQSAG